MLLAAHAILHLSHLEELHHVVEFLHHWMLEKHSLIVIPEEENSFYTRCERKLH
jgi:hypothetical protein